MGQRIVLVDDPGQALARRGPPCPNFGGGNVSHSSLSSRQSSIQTAREIASPSPDSTALFDAAAQGVLQQRLFGSCLVPCPDYAEIKAIASVLSQTRSLALAESRAAIARSRVALDERRVACLEETSSLNRQIKQSAQDGKEKGLRDWEKIWAIISPSPHGRDSSTPPAHETGPTPAPNPESPQDQPLPPFE